MCNDRKDKTIWNKTDYISKNIGEHSKHSQLFSVYPKSSDLHKRYQIVPIHPLFSRHSSVFFWKKEKVNEKQYIQYKQKYAQTFDFTFCTLFQFLPLSWLQIRISDFLFKSLLPLTIISTPAATPVTSVTIPTAILHAPVRLIVLYIFSFMAIPPYTIQTTPRLSGRSDFILLRTDCNMHQLPFSVHHQ